MTDWIESVLGERPLMSYEDFIRDGKIISRYTLFDGVGKKVSDVLDVKSGILSIFFLQGYDVNRFQFRSIGRHRC